MSIVKKDIHSFFIQRVETSRSGGGTLKKKNMYTTHSTKKQNEMYESIKDNLYLSTYFKKLQNRDRKLAPPPKPK
jgi:hypothetical protein